MCTFTMWTMWISMLKTCISVLVWYIVWFVSWCHMILSWSWYCPKLTYLLLDIKHLSIIYDNLSFAKILWNKEIITYLSENFYVGICNSNRIIISNNMICISHFLFWLSLKLLILFDWLQVLMSLLREIVLPSSLCSQKSCIIVRCHERLSWWILF